MAQRRHSPDCYCVSQPQVFWSKKTNEPQSLLPLQISNKMWLLLFQDFVEDVFAYAPTRSQGSVVELPHLRLSGRGLQDLIITFLLDYATSQKTVQDWPYVAHSLDQLRLVFIHKNLP